VLRFDVLDREHRGRDPVGVERVSEGADRWVRRGLQQQLHGGFSRRADGQPTVTVTERDVGAGFEPEDVGVEGQRLGPIVDEDAGEVDAHGSLLRGGGSGQPPVIASRNEVQIVVHQQPVHDLEQRLVVTGRQDVQDGPPNGCTQSVEHVGHAYGGAGPDDARTLPRRRPRDRRPSGVRRAASRASAGTGPPRPCPRAPAPWSRAPSRARTGTTAPRTSRRGRRRRPGSRPARAPGRSR
jgi:hypothetical protein